MDVRAGTVISETWEDGQALKDLNAHLVRHLYTSVITVFRANLNLFSNNLAGCCFFLLLENYGAVIIVLLIFVVDKIFS